MYRVVRQWKSESRQCSEKVRLRVAVQGALKDGPRNESRRI